jgi:hypothetical protein
MEHFPRKKEISPPMISTHLETNVRKPSYMAIKKALYGRQTGCFYACFYF